MTTITTEQLKQKLERGDSFNLIMTYHEWAYKKAHIPGSRLMESPQEAVKLLSTEDEVIVYCINEGCLASIQAYQALEKEGFTNLKRYSEGIEGWQMAGLEVAKSTNQNQKSD